MRNIFHIFFPTHFPFSIFFVSFPLYLPRFVSVFTLRQTTHSYVAFPCFFSPFFLFFAPFCFINSSGICLCISCPTKLECFRLFPFPLPVPQFMELVAAACFRRHSTLALSLRLGLILMCDSERDSQRERERGTTL